MLLERGIQIMSKTHHSIQGDTAQEHRWLAASTAAAYTAREVGVTMAKPSRLKAQEICRSKQGRQPHKTWYDRQLLSTCQHDWQGDGLHLPNYLAKPTETFRADRYSTIQAENGRFQKDALWESSTTKSP
jgi:hypothetical protein